MPKQCRLFETQCTWIHHRTLAGH